MGFIQFTDSKTENIDEFSLGIDHWIAESTDSHGETKVTLCVDRDSSRTDVHTVEFPSSEVAMANSNDLRNAEFGARMANVIDDGRQLRTLNVHRTEDV